MDPTNTHALSGKEYSEKMSHFDEDKCHKHGFAVWSHQAMIWPQIPTTTVILALHKFITEHLDRICGIFSSNSTVGAEKRRSHAAINSRIKAAPAAAALRWTRCMG